MDRLTRPENLTIREMFIDPVKYSGLSDQLAALPCPGELQFDSTGFQIPADLDQFSAAITYGQKYFMATAERIDLNVIVRYIGGYYYPMVTGQKWDEPACLAWATKTLPPMKVVELYPAANRLLTLMAELVAREQKLLHREPSKQEQHAHIERLDKFGDLSALKFLQNEFKIPRGEVMQLPYNDCLVEFVYNHEQALFTERLTEVYRKEQESKTKYK
jgi:hypothetical protein